MFKLQYYNSERSAKKHLEGDLKYIFRMPELSVKGTEAKQKKKPHQKAFSVQIMETLKGDSTFKRTAFRFHGLTMGKIIFYIPEIERLTLMAAKKYRSNIGQKFQLELYFGLSLQEEQATVSLKHSWFQSK